MASVLSAIDNDMNSRRYHHGLDHDNDQHGGEVITPAHLLRESYRHLPGILFRIRVRRLAGVRRRQLHVLGSARQEEKRQGPAAVQRSRQRGPGRPRAVAHPVHSQPPRPL